MRHLLLVLVSLINSAIAVGEVKLANELPIEKIVYGDDGDVD